MKLIKKIASIMFAFMMVFTLRSNVNAETITGGDSPQNGSITIKNAEKGHTYTIYRILALDSYSYEKTETNTKKEGNYSYSLIGNGWDNFIRDNSGADGFFTITDDKYVTFNDGKSVEELAKKAITYANDSAHHITNDGQKPKNGEEDVKFENLPLGYYLIDSSMGALCSLNTTNRDATVFEKNEKPEIKKYINTEPNHLPTASVDYLKKECTSIIGDTVNFLVTIDYLKGSDNFVVEDTLGNGFKYNATDDFTMFRPHIVAYKKNEGTVTDTDQKQFILNTDYTLEKGTSTSEKSFNIKFTKAGCNKLSLLTDYQLRISYNLYMGNETEFKNTNSVLLKYGNSHSTEKENAYVYALKIPVFKCKSDKTTGLSDAKFSLYKTKEDANSNSNPIYFVKKVESTYRVADDVDTKAEGEAWHTITTDASGTFILFGLKEGTYYLKEVEAPKGYNKLTEPITVDVKPTVDSTTTLINGQTINYTYKTDTKQNVNKVVVVNKTGSLLPSTGGMGTTLIYLIGGALVLGSGFVLINKKRAKAK